MGFSSVENLGDKLIFPWAQEGEVHCSRASRLVFHLPLRMSGPESLGSDVLTAHLKWVLLLRAQHNLTVIIITFFFLKVWLIN